MEEYKSIVFKNCVLTGNPPTPEAELRAHLGLAARHLHCATKIVHQEKGFRGWLYRIRLSKAHDLTMKLHLKELRKAYLGSDTGMG